jgi:hypothetical protein
MNGGEDLPRVMLQKPQHAAEAALASTRLLESEACHRLAAIEARMVSVEGRLAVLSARQSSQRLSPIRIAAPQSETTRFEGIDKRFDRIEKMLTEILAKLP